MSILGLVVGIIAGWLAERITGRSHGLHCPRHGHYYRDSGPSVELRFGNGHSHHHHRHHRDR